MLTRCWKPVGLLLLPFFLMLTLSVTAQAEGEIPLPPARHGVVAQASFADPADLQALVARYDIWHVDHAERLVTLWLMPDALQQLRSEGRWVIVDQTMTAEFYASQPATVNAANIDGIPGYACYRTVEETYASMTDLAAAYPMLVREVTIGESWRSVQSAGAEGYAMRGVVLTNQAAPGPKPIFFLMGAIHAREYTTAESAMRFAEQLVHGYGIDADATWLLDYTEIHVVPQANPDGRKRAESGWWWRKNVNNSLCVYEDDYYGWGIDLNRNSSFKWAQCTGYDCSSSDPCAITYRGTAAGSEPETAALEAYMRAIFADVRGERDSDPAPVDATGVMISLHSYAPLVLFPWGWTQAQSPNHAELQTLARKFGFYTQYPACQSGAPGCIYMTDGTTDDFAYGELGVAAYTFELGTRFFQQCSTFESSIITPTLASLTYAAKAAIKPYVAPSGPEVLDVTLSATGPITAGEIVTLTATADDSRYYSGGYGTEPVQAIQAMRYSVGQPSWITDTVTYPMTPTHGAFTLPVEPAFAAIDTTEWTDGQHLIFVEAQDASGVWGVPTAFFVRIGESVGERRYLPFVQR